MVTGTCVMCGSQCGVALYGSLNNQSVAQHAKQQVPTGTSHG